MGGILKFFVFIAETITESDLLGVQDKTNRHLRLREYVLGKTCLSTARLS